MCVCVCVCMCDFLMDSLLLTLFLKELEQISC